jgi:hypothetical protein
MKKALLLGLGASALVAIGTGCAEQHHAYHPVNEPVVVPGPVVVTPVPSTSQTVISAPPTTVVVPAVTENQAVQIARAEAMRHGWRNVGVSQAGFYNDRWHVDLYNEPHHHVEHYGWVEVAPNGDVLHFSDSPRHRADWYREHHYRY